MDTQEPKLFAVVDSGTSATLQPGSTTSSVEGNTSAWSPRTYQDTITKIHLESIEPDDGEWVRCKPQRGTNLLYGKFPIHSKLFKLSELVEILPEPVKERPLPEFNSVPEPYFTEVNPSDPDGVAIPIQTGSRHDLVWLLRAINQNKF